MNLNDVLEHERKHAEKTSKTLADLTDGRALKSNIYFKNNPEAYAAHLSEIKTNQQCYKKGVKEVILVMRKFLAVQLFLGY